MDRPNREQDQQRLSHWLQGKEAELLQDYHGNQQGWVVPDEVLKKAMHELGDWVLYFLYPGDKEHTLHLKWEVCGTCDGRGKHVNPSIDAHGISPEEFQEDEGFREDYLAGAYDVPCYECGGRTTSPVIDREHTSGETIRFVNDWLDEEYSYQQTVLAERRMGA